MQQCKRCLRRQTHQLVQSDAVCGCDRCWMRSVTRHLTKGRSRLRVRHAAIALMSSLCCAALSSACARQQAPAPEACLRSML